MTSYPDDNSGSYDAPGSGPGPYQQGGQGGQHGGQQGGQAGSYAGGATPHSETGQHYETQQFSQPHSPQQQWQGPGQPGYQGYQQGHYGGGSGGSNRPSINIRRTFKTSEFWVMVVVAIALLIAAAVTDSGPDNQGFSAEDAWRYVTALAVAYILSRGLSKFGGHERDDHNRHDR